MTEQDLIDIGKRIRDARTDAQLSLEEVAAAVGVAPSTIQRYEKGKIARIKLPVIESIASALHVDPAWLLLKTDDRYDYFVDPDNRLADVPIAIFKELMDHYNDPEQVYLTWRKMEDDTAKEVSYESAVAHLKAEGKKLGLVVSDQDPQVEGLLNCMEQLNAQGKQKVLEYAEDLVASEKYAKKSV